MFSVRLPWQPGLYCHVSYVFLALLLASPNAHNPSWTAMWIFNNKYFWTHSLYLLSIQTINEQHSVSKCTRRPYFIGRHNSDFRFITVLHHAARVAEKGRAAGARSQTDLLSRMLSMAHLVFQRLGNMAWLLSWALLPPPDSMAGWPFVNRQHGTNHWHAKRQLSRTGIIHLMKWRATAQMGQYCSRYFIVTSLISRVMGPTWGPSGAARTQVGPMLAPWTLLSGVIQLFAKFKTICILLWWGYICF